MKRIAVPHDSLQAVSLGSHIAILCGRMGDRLLVEDPTQGIVEARTTLRLGHKALAAAIAARREVVVTHCGDTRVVTGLLEALPGHAAHPSDDEEELVLNSPKGVLLRCGEASIQLTPDGRVLVRGKDVVTRAKRRNHVVGGIVRLN